MFLLKFTQGLVIDIVYIFTVACTIWSSWVQSKPVNHNLHKMTFLCSFKRLIYLLLLFNILGHSLYNFTAKLLTNVPNFCQQKMNTNTIYYLTCVLVSKLFLRVSVKMSCIYIGPDKEILFA